MISYCFSKTLEGKVGITRSVICGEVEDMMNSVNGGEPV